MRKLSPALAVLFCASLLDARQDKLSCGSHPDRWREEVQLHRQSEQHGAKRSAKPVALARVAGAEVVGGVSVRPDIGNIAILDDADGVVSRRNPFNLNKRTLRFVPSGDTRKYTYELADDTYDAAAASGGTLLTGLGDDDSREVTLPFSFPFYGGRHNSVFVNSDGNLTFESGDAAITDRSLGRFTSGPPRIAALFRDLDPSRSRNGVTTYAAGDKFVISWIQVPEFRDTGTGPLQTFQVRLFPDGRIELAWTEVSTEESVTGIAPGRLQGSTSVVSFAGTRSGEYTAAVAERFSGSEQIDIFSAAQKFYLNHEDTYDYLVIYNNLGIDADQDAVAYEVTIRNNRSGYGDEKIDVGFETGSKRRLQAILNMGPLDQYPADPNGKVAARLSVGDTPLTVLAHEAGHLFLAFASVRDQDGGRPMLGYQTAHWNFVFNSDASLLEGNRIQDNGPEASPRFLTTATVQGFSALDQYLMGLRAPEEVPDTFYVENARGSRISGLPRVGASFDGTRRDVRVDEIVQAEGRRTPDHSVAQRKFRFAFLFITQAGTEPTAEQLQQVEAYRVAFEEFFNKATSNRAAADTSIKKSLRISTWPAAGVTLGGTATGTVTIEQPAATDLTVLLRPQNGGIDTPASVTIRAGQTQANFTFTGRHAGTDELLAEPADTRYTTVHSRIQVVGTEALRLLVTGGDLQTARPGTQLLEPVRIRVTDLNELPYPGIALTAQVSAGGLLDNSTAVTDETGTAWFRWTPGTAAENELRASLPGGATVVATALGQPALANGGVVNAASFAPGLATGGIGTIFGLNLADRGTAQVLLNGQSVPVFYSSTRQVNFHVPYGTPSGTANLVVRTSVGTSDAMPVNIADLQPGIFFDAVSGYGAITVAGTGQVTQVRPVSRGETIEIYTTGLGAFQTQPSGHRITDVTPQVFIGGSAAEVTFSGIAPGFTGLYQINAVVPAGVGTGTQPVAVVSNGLRSNEVRIQVR